MPTSTINYGTSAALTITLASLASDTNLLAGRTAAALDNTTTKAIDYSLRFKTRTGTTLTANRVIELWAAPSEDGTNYSGGNGGTDAAKTHVAESKEAMVLLAAIRTNSTNSTDYEFNLASLAGALGGAIPRKVGFFVVQNSGAALDATGGNHVLTLTPIKYDSA
jgi:hypothetical protein